MQNAATARTLSHDILTGLTYIDALISGATLMGLYTITIESPIVTRDTAMTLRSLGYNVLECEPRDYAGQLYTRYIIDWTPITPTPSISISVTPTKTPSITPSITTSISISVTPSITVSNSVTPSITPSITPTITVSKSVTPTVTPTITVSNSVTPTITTTPTVTPTITTTPTVTPSITVSNSVTPTVTPSISISPSKTPSITPSLTPTPSILPNVQIWNSSGTYNITGVTISGVTVSGVSFPVLPGENKSGFTTKGLTGITIIVGLSSVSTGECINIDGELHTTDGNYQYISTNGSTNSVSIIYESSPC